jgi:hypothetical protein
MAERALTPAELNRTALDRQLLLRRSSAAIPSALERVGLLQTQYAPTGYIGLWSRLAGFERRQLTAALEGGAVLQGTMLRSTIHMASAADHPYVIAGTQRALRAWWLRVAKPRGLADVDHERAAAVVGAELAHGPRRRAELVAALEAAGFPRDVWEGLGHWLPMVRAAPSGTWEHRRADLYALAPAAIELDEDVAVAHLVRRHLGAFGPAAPGDIASWAGLPIGTVRATLDGMTELRARRHSDGTVLVDLPNAVIADGDVPAPPRFLSNWEALLLAHARRAGVLAEDHRALVFRTKNPQSEATFLVDGRVAGTWRFEAGAVVLQEFAPIPAKFRRDLTDEKDALAAWLGRP